MTPHTDQDQTAQDQDLTTDVAPEDLIEEVSIDGMCGVY